MTENQFGFVEKLTKDCDQYRIFQNTALDAVQDMIDICDEEFDSKTDWKLDSEDADVGIKCWSRTWKNEKLFTVQAFFDKHIMQVHDELLDDFFKAAEWDPSVSERDMVLQVGDRTQLVYQSMTNVLPFISGRDFVGVRTWREINGTIFHAGKSVEADQVPPKKGKVRAVTYLTGGRLTKLGPKRCMLESLLCFDMKGYIPKFAVNATVGARLITQMLNLRVHLDGQLGDHRLCSSFRANVPSG